MWTQGHHEGPQEREAGGQRKRRRRENGVGVGVVAPMAGGHLPKNVSASGSRRKPGRGFSPGASREASPAPASPPAP